MDETTRGRAVPWGEAAQGTNTPWQERGVIEEDGDRFRAHFNAHRQQLALTPPQVADALDVLARAGAADRALLEPTAPSALRGQALARVLRPAIERGQIRGLSLCDEATLRAIYEATLSWGPKVQPLLDDPGVTEVKIIGRAALAESARGPIVVPDAYASVEEPLSRAQALAQISGVTWDATRPSVTIALPNKVRLHMTRRPTLADDDLLLVIRRGRSDPWTVDTLVRRRAIAPDAAALLRALVEARLSVIISGVQGSGKTTVLECLLNALPASAHLVLIEDNTDELTIELPLVTRLRVNASGADASDPYADIVRETLRMTPDLVAPSEVRGAEAAAVVQIAEAGRPTATTIHGDSPEAALLRLATMAATDTPGNRLARQTGLALRVIARAFHAIVHVAHSPALGRRVVESVHLLDGVGPDGEPRLLPLITSSIAPASDAWDITWQCRARLLSDALAWDDAALRTPPAVARRLAERPALMRRAALRERAADDQLSDLLDRARRAIDTDASGEAACADLARARSLTPEHPEVWALAERLLATNTAVRERARKGGEARLVTIQAALRARDLAAARQAAEGESDIAEAVWLRQSRAWREALDAVDALALTVQAFEDASAAAHTYATADQFRDFARALACLQPFQASDLPEAQRESLLTARAHLLSALLREQPASVARPLWEQQLAELRALLAPPVAPPEEAVEDAGRDAADASAGDEEESGDLSGRVSPEYRATLARLAERSRGGL